MMLKYVCSIFQILFQILLVMAITVTAADHVSAVSCAENSDCLRHLDAEVVAAMRANLHNSSDPCENFWVYACGEWTAAPYDDHVDTFGAINNYYGRRMRKLLLATPTSLQNKPKDDITRLLRKMRTVYKSCTSIDDSYSLPVTRYLEALITSVQWPRSLDELLTMDWSHFSWSNVIAEMRRYGLNGVFLDESVGVRFNDSTRPVIELKMPDEDDEGDDSFASKYEILEYFAKFGWIRDEDSASVIQLRIAAEIYELETQLKDLRQKHVSTLTEKTETSGDKNNASQAVQDMSVAISFEELKRRVPNIDWQSYFSILIGLKSAHTDLAIEVEGVAYMGDLAAMLTQSDVKVIAGYILLRLCKYVRAIAPKRTATNCVNHMGVVMPLGMDYTYDRFVYGSERHQRDNAALQVIFERLKLQFGKYLRQNHLQLNVAQQRYLCSKLEHMQLRLGNLPQNNSSDFYDDFYESANVSADFYHNHWELLRFRTQQQHNALLTSAPIILDSFFVNDDIRQVRNAPYFVHQRNLLVVPLLFVQPPFFHHQLDARLQYSLMGWILGHELNHAFETEGILLDGDGNESHLGAGIRAKREFQAAAHCLERQQPLSVALIERIADVNGLQLAYDAYFSTSNPLPPPYAAEFSTPQLFFLNFAQFFCGRLPRPIGHDRDDVRVVTAVANIPKFAAAFDCEPKSVENPTEKCQMWRRG